jgi:hypothetical protein
VPSIEGTPRRPTTAPVPRSPKNWVDHCVRPLYELMFGLPAPTRAKRGPIQLRLRQLRETARQFASHEEVKNEKCSITPVDIPGIAADGSEIRDRRYSPPGPPADYNRVTEVYTMKTITIEVPDEMTALGGGSGESFPCLRLFN